MNKTPIIYCILYFLITLPANLSGGWNPLSWFSTSTLFKKPSLEEEIKKLQAEQIDHPNNPYVTYNLGVALYKKGEYEASQANFKRLTKNKKAPEKIKNQAFFNIGNCCYNQAVGLLPKKWQFKKINLELIDQALSYCHEGITALNEFLDHHKEHEKAKINKHIITELQGQLEKKKEEKKDSNQEQKKDQNQESQDQENNNQENNNQENNNQENNKNSSRNKQDKQEKKKQGSGSNEKPDNQEKSDNNQEKKSREESINKNKDEASQGSKEKLDEEQNGDEEQEEMKHSTPNTKDTQDQEDTSHEDKGNLESKEMQEEEDAKSDTLDTKENSKSDTLDKEENKKEEDKEQKNISSSESQESEKKNSYSHQQKTIRALLKSLDKEEEVVHQRVLKKQLSRQKPGSRPAHQRSW